MLKNDSDPSVVVDATAQAATTRDQPTLSRNSGFETLQRKDDPCANAPCPVSTQEEGRQTSRDLQEQAVFQSTNDSAVNTPHDDELTGELFPDRVPLKPRPCVRILHSFRKRAGRLLKWRRGEIGETITSGSKRSFQTNDRDHRPLSCETTITSINPQCTPASASTDATSTVPTPLSNFGVSAAPAGAEECAASQVDDASDEHAPLDALTASKGNIAEAPTQPRVESVPLLKASATDDFVHNDTLKVMMLSANTCTAHKSWLASAIKGSTHRPWGTPALTVDVFEWISDVEEHPTRFLIWDVNAGTTSAGADCSLHAGTQSVFISSGALYILTWDLAWNNPNTNLDEAYTHPNEALQAEIRDRVFLAVRADILERLVPLVDCVARYGHQSAILPVAVVPEGMEGSEADWRCDLMLRILQEHIENHTALVLGSDGGTMLRVTQGDNAGVARLREVMISATERSPIFSHVGSAVPVETVLVLQAIQEFRERRFKVIELDMLCGKVRSLCTEKIFEALHFLTRIGNIMYFGSCVSSSGDDTILSRYVVLCKYWMASALSCVLKENLKQGLKNALRTSKMMGIECSHLCITNEVKNSLIGDTASNCPLLSFHDAELLWICKPFVKDAADRCRDTSGSAPTLFRFLERLLIHRGVLVPLELSNVCFVPGCLSEPPNRDELWTYKSKHSWTTTLAHVWTLEDGMPPRLFEQVSVNLLRALAEYSTDFQGSFLEVDNLESVGPISVQQVMRWKSCMLVKVKTEFHYRGFRAIETTVEIFLAIVNRSSSHCVASSIACSQQLVISGKGLEGCHGRWLWRAGYRVALESVGATMSKAYSVDSEVICPECLAHGNPRDAGLWSCSGAQKIAESSDSIECRHGHRVDIHLLCGTTGTSETLAFGEPIALFQPDKPQQDIVPSVVLIAAWNPKTKKLFNAGSGFIAHATLGLVVTAAHIPFVTDEGDEEFGGLFVAPLVLGVVPQGQTSARFRYVAEVVADAHDVYKVDACVLRIKGRLAHDLDKNSPGCAKQLEKVLYEGLLPMNNENLTSLEMTKQYETEQTVRILGFPQGGEGKYDSSTIPVVDTTIDFVDGIIRREFNSDAFFVNTKALNPHKELILKMCRTIGGHSGGPCINTKGEVVGILSRGDHADPWQSFLVPSSEIMRLLNVAIMKCN